MLSSLALGACNKNDSGTAAADPNAMITLTKPLGGETYHVGDTLRVGWTVKTDPSDQITSVDVVLSPDSGKTWVYLPYGPLQNRTGSITPLSPYWNKFAWAVTESLYVAGTNSKIKLAGNAHCLVRVEDYDNPNLATRHATTPSYITISP